MSDLRDLTDIDDMESITSIVQRNQDAGKQLSEDVAEKKRKISQRLKVLRSPNKVDALKDKLIDTRYRYVDKSRRSKPG